MAGSGAAVSVSAGAAWAVLERIDKVDHLTPLARTLGKNAVESG